MYDTPYASHTSSHDGEEGFGVSEVWQFLMILPGFVVAAVSWHIVVYLPGRTLERWESQTVARPGRRPVRVARTGP